MLTARDKKPRPGPGGGSVGKAFAVQTQGPEFGSPASMEKPGVTAPATLASEKPSAQLNRGTPGLVRYLIPINQSINKGE